MNLAAERLLESVLQLAKVTGFLAVIALPAIWVCVRRLTGLSMLARLATGMAAGYALFVVEAWYVGFWSMAPLVYVWLSHYVVAAWLGRRVAVGREPVLPARDAASQAGPSHRRAAWLVIAPIAAGVLFQLYGQQFSRLPPGVDPAFHCVVAQVQRDAGRATLDLMPLEELRLNYPIGMHLWLAIAAEWTGLEVHEVFNQSFIIALCGGALCVAAWSERLFGATAHAVAGAFMFVFGSFHTSLFPYTWGGLPSALAIWLGGSALFCVGGVGGRAGFWLGTLLFAGTAMTHHHTLVALFGGVGCVAVAGWLVWRESRPLCVRVLSSLAAATVLAAPYTVLLAARFGDLDRTSTLTYREGDAVWPWQLVWDWGLPLVGLAAIGIAAGGVSAERWNRRAWIGLLLFWLGSFVVLDYGARWLLPRLGRPEATPFSPSRFLFDAQFVLAIFAGGGFVLAWQWMRRPAFRYALIVGVACWGTARTSHRLEPMVSDLLLPLGQSGREQLPRNALITGSENVWVTYVFRRQSTSMFVPVSEAGNTPWRRMKYALRYETEMFSCAEWERRLGVPIYVISGSADRSWRQPPLAVAGPQALYRFRPAGE